MSVFDNLVVWTIPFIPKALVRRASSRYIAGKDLADAVRVVSRLNENSCMATLDVLGEFITKKEDADEAVGEYLKALDTIEKEKLDSNISVKLTMLGLKLDRDFCLDKMRLLVSRAKEHHNFVRIDMEDATCTTDTLYVHGELRKEFDNAGFVIQSYMRRSMDDIRAQMKQHKQVNVRLCKGIYIESRDIAYKDKQIVNSNFVRLLEELLVNGHYAGIATHDEKLVWAAFDLIDRLKLDREQYEFQMLLGVDEQLRNIILREGHRLRIYVPYGQQWHAYSVRRLKENPMIARYAMKSFLGIK